MKKFKKTIIQNTGISIMMKRLRSSTMVYTGPMTKITDLWLLATGKKAEDVGIN